MSIREQLSGQIPFWVRDDSAWKIGVGADLKNGRVMRMVCDFSGLMTVVSPRLKPVLLYCAEFSQGGKDKQFTEKQDFEWRV